MTLNAELSQGRIQNKYRINKDGWYADPGCTFSLNQFILDDDAVNTLETYAVGLNKKWAQEKPNVANMFFHPSTRTYPVKALDFGYVKLEYNFGDQLEDDSDSISDHQFKSLEKLEDSQLEQFL